MEGEENLRTIYSKFEQKMHNLKGREKDLLGFLLNGLILEGVLVSEMSRLSEEERAAAKALKIVCSRLRNRIDKGSVLERR